jgi:hypothetical protein
MGGRTGCWEGGPCAGIVVGWLVVAFTGARCPLRLVWIAVFDSEVPRLPRTVQVRSVDPQTSDNQATVPDDADESRLCR